MASETVHPFSDDPLEDPDRDLLERHPFVVSMTRALDDAAAGRASVVFSLVGPWGAGKSSILSFVKRELRAGIRDWDVVDFNPWSYPDETSMQLGFFSELQAVLTGKGRGKKARKAVGRLSTSLAPYAGLAGSLVNVDGEALAKGLGSILNGDITSSKAFEEAKRALTGTTKSILLILDDLDRLDPGELVLVAKLVRLVGRLPNVFYLLSFDEETLLDVLRRTPLVGGSEARAKDYLEKIVQRRFDIPPLRHATAESLVNDRLSAIVSRLGIEIQADDRIRFSDLYQSVLAARLRTVRSINRFFSQLDSFDRTLAVEVNVIDFILLTWIRVAEPRLYLLLFDRKDWALHAPNIAAEGAPGVPGRRQALLKVLTHAGVAPEHADGVAILIAALFPTHRADEGLAGRAAPSPDETARERRLSHPDFFNRYFAYTVTDDDTSDVVIDAGLEAIVSGEEGAHRRDLERALVAQTELVTRKIRTRNVPPGPLAMWLLGMFDRVPNERTWTGGDRYHLERSLRDAIVRIPASEFDATIADLVIHDDGAQQIVELGLGLHGGIFLGLEEDTAKNLELIRDPLERHLPTLIPRVLTTYLPAGPLDIDPEFWMILRLWQVVTPGAPKAWLKTLLLSESWPLLDTVAVFVPRWQTSDRVRPSHLDHLDLQVIETYFDLDDLLDRLEEDLRNARQSAVPAREEPDTPDGRRRITLLTLRTALLQRDENRRRQ